MITWSIQWKRVAGAGLNITNHNLCIGLRYNYSYIINLKFRIYLLNNTSSTNVNLIYSTCIFSLLQFVKWLKLNIILFFNIITNWLKFDKNKNKKCAKKKSCTFY